MDGKFKGFLAALTIVTFAIVGILLPNRSDSQEQIWAFGALVLVALGGLGLVMRSRKDTPTLQDPQSP